MEKEHLMYQGRIIFSQLFDFLPKYEFNKCVHRYHGNRRVRNFTCFNQFLCMTFAQITGRESLRDIETCLRAMKPKLYHAGFRGAVSRSTLADANAKRNWRIFHDFAHVLINVARPLYAREEFGVEIEQMAYALDSTLIDLCLTLFPWAKFRRRKAAVKMHTLMDLRGSIPCFIHVSHGKLHDVNILDEIIWEPGAFYVMDRAYTDFGRLYELNQSAAFFVIPAKCNLLFQRRASRPVDKSTGLRCDQTVSLMGPKTTQDYPDFLRRVGFKDPETGKRFVFLTNNFFLAPLTVTRLYKCRWRIELFFKWIKQHLRIKSFFGTTPNAVKTQIWIAISVYVLAAVLKKRLKIERSLMEILQILSIALFEKTPIKQALESDYMLKKEPDSSIQLNLFDF